MVPKAPMQSTEHGMVPAGRGWFVLNARDAPWIERPGRGAYCEFEGSEGQADFAQLGINLQVLGPGEPMAMYHYENDQEDFLVLAGEPLLIAEGQQRPLKPWDFVHFPAGAGHVIVGAGDVPCLILAVGARDRSTGLDWGAYTVDPAAIRHGAGVEAETTEPDVAYARFPAPRPTRYRDGWLT
ncbi:MAG: cupin domain-containing protein [Gaiellales bacterium]